MGFEFPITWELWILRGEGSVPSFAKTLQKVEKCVVLDHFWQFFKFLRSFCKNSSQDLPPGRAKKIFLNFSKFLPGKYTYACFRRRETWCRLCLYDLKSKNYWKLTVVVKMSIFYHFWILKRKNNDAIVFPRHQNWT